MKPVSGFHVKVTDVPSVFIHDEVVQAPNVSVRSPHLVAGNSLNAA